MATQPFYLIGKVMSKRAADFGVASRKLTVTIASVIGEDVVRETPVDEGVARSNWIMSLDQIATYTIPAYDPHPKTHHSVYARRALERAAGIVHVLGTGDKEESGNLIGALSQHFATLQQYDPVRNKTVYLANHLPYIGKLNAGSSPQTEAGFVQRAVEKGLDAAKRKKLMEAA